ncbi:MAG: VWA domain-containing protein [Solirubrobacterales bacterium]
MKINAKLDFDLVAVESEDTVHVLLDLTAPTPESTEARPPATLQVVLDRSGSMAGDRLEAALVAIDRLLNRLGPEDRFGLVMFDDQVQVPVAAGPVGDGSHARAVLPQIFAGGMTDLASGYMRGIQEAQRVTPDDGSATLVLLSDGHANTGVTDWATLEQFAAGAQRARVSSSTVGIGLGYDEDLLAVIARGGSGNTHFAESGDDAGAALASEVEGLLTESVQAVSLTVRPSDDVSAVRLYNDLPATSIDGGFMVELGNLHAAEQRRLILEADVPAIAGVGLASICDLELRWVDLGTMKSERADIPVHVNVVPGDEAAGRTQDPEVTTELSFQKAQRAKREASDALAEGDVSRAQQIYRGASAVLDDVDLDQVDASVATEVAEELKMLQLLEMQAESDQLMARKRGMADHHMKSRKRGRKGMS